MKWGLAEITHGKCWEECLVQVISEVSYYCDRHKGDPSTCLAYQLRQINSLKDLRAQAPWISTQGSLSHSLTQVSRCCWVPRPITGCFPLSTRRNHYPGQLFSFFTVKLDWPSSFKFLHLLTSHTDYEAHPVCLLWRTLQLREKEIKSFLSHTVPNNVRFPSTPISSPETSPRPL